MQTITQTEPIGEQAIQLDCWQVLPMLGTVRNGADERHLEPRVMAVLLVLLAHPGKVLSRQDLLAAVWGDVVVGDEALTRCISILRRTLDDTGAQRRVIQTLPKRGYRLLLAPSPAATAPPPAATTAPPATTALPPATKLAVPLPAARAAGMLMLALLLALALAQLTGPGAGTGAGNNVGRALGVAIGAAGHHSQVAGLSPRALNVFADCTEAQTRSADPLC